MAKVKVPGTILRGEIYYSNVKIPKSLRDQYGGKEHLRESLRTSDPAAAKARLEVIRATIKLDKESANRRKDPDRLVEALRPEDQAIFRAAGGLEGLLRRFEAGQVAQRFVEAAAPVRLPNDDEDDRDDDALEADLAAHRAQLGTMRAESNRDGKVLRRLGEEVDLDGEVDSLRDVIDQWAPSVDAHRRAKRTEIAHRIEYLREERSLATTAELPGRWDAHALREVAREATAALTAALRACESDPNVPESARSSVRREAVRHAGRVHRAGASRPDVAQSDKGRTSSMLTAALERLHLCNCDSTDHEEPENPA